VIRLGEHVEYVGADDPISGLYTGHPGMVVHLPPFDEVDVAFSGSATIGLPADQVRLIDSATFELRSTRLHDGLHPVREQNLPS
jgi:hypothetical protein